MFAVLSDTHSQSGHELAGRARGAVDAADAVVHAGDFTTEAALDAFHDASERLHAVYGNSDTTAVRDRLPESRTVDLGPVRAVVTHRSRSGPTGLRLLARQHGVSLVIRGHTHRPAVESLGGVTVLNPGSHAEPRGNPRAHAELEPRGDGLDGTLRTRDGGVIEEFRVAAGPEATENE